METAINSQPARSDRSSTKSFLLWHLMTGGICDPQQLASLVGVAVDPAFIGEIGRLQKQEKPKERFAHLREGNRVRCLICCVPLVMIPCLCCDMHGRPERYRYIPPSPAAFCSESRHLEAAVKWHGA